MLNVLKLTPQSRIKCLGNMDVAVADAFMSAVATNKTTIEIVRKDMLTAAAKCLAEINFDKTTPPPTLGCGSEWIKCDEIADVVGPDEKQNRSRGCVH